MSTPLSRTLRRIGRLVYGHRTRRFAAFYVMQPLYGADGHIRDCIVSDCNEQAASLYGQTRAEVVGSSLASYYHPQQLRMLLEVYELALRLGQYEDEIQMPGSGSVYLEWARRRFRRSGEHLHVHIDDVGVERAQAVELSRLAYHDRLTGLPNRSWLMEALPGMLATGGDHELLLALIDLNRFSDLNDALGMTRADAILSWLARRLQRAMLAGTVVARFGADEFAVLVRRVPGTDAADVIDLLQRVLYDRPCPHAPALSAAIGISQHPRDAASAETLVAHAELALQEAKQSGKAMVVEYGAQLSSRLQLGRDLEAALLPANAGQLFLMLQPRICLRTGEMVSMEALARWRHPLHGLVPPSSFIPLAEQRQLIVPLGQLMFETVCRQLAQWRASGLALRPVSVNVSPYQLQHRTLRDELLACMARHGIGAELLELEITESAMLGEQPQVIEQLRGLRESGFRLAMDDFGVGYSSLSQLKNLDMQVLKIDRTFTADLAAGHQGQVLFEAIVAMAQALGMRVVAEGVETAAQLAVLRTLACDEAQGYLLARPMSATDMAQALRMAMSMVVPASVSSPGRSQIQQNMPAPLDTPDSKYSPLRRVQIEKA